ncbi:arginine repressor [Clostridium frigidicarnis]|uniref:Arginine repressor n=1 Tax=Clostridium frigidicarnis TaxID=84698 RepID=A0A1I0WHW3_9CLOT|nr:arginine repressor [Clostridium frigidicarnis]SFA87583.1 transcriptional regulator, ArgR family [Clostridium frigidicarnis]
MKSVRHKKILEIVNSSDIETQDELAEALRQNGFDITQATISRDIKILKLAKVMAANGRYKYVSVEKDTMDFSNKLVKIFANTVLNVESVDNFVVIKTLSGSGSAAAEAIDSLGLKEIAGTIAGDNTIFILTRSKENSNQLVDKIKAMIE